MERLNTQNRLKDFRKTATTAILAMSLAACSSNVTETPKSTIQPTESPTPTLMIFPSPEITPTPTPEITLSPTPEPSPTPDMTKWWNQIPENPYKNIEDVPYLKDVNGIESKGMIRMESFFLPPNFYLSIKALTITDVVPNIEDNSIKIAVSSKGDKIEKKDCVLTNVNGTNINMCNYSGATLWLNINERTIIVKGSEVIGMGPEALAKYLKIGSSFQDVGIFFKNYQRNNATKEELALNTNSYKELKSSIGETFPRSNTRFTFFPGVIGVSPISNP